MDGYFSFWEKAVDKLLKVGRNMIHGDQGGEGVYYPDGSFKSASKIRLESLEQGKPVFHTPMPGDKNFEYWQKEMIARRDVRLENEGRPERVELEIPTEYPIVIAQMGDHHLGGMYHAYELMGEHAQVIKEHPLFYVAFGGDITDSFFFNPAQDKAIADYHEERAHARAMMEFIGKDKILWAVEGDHDMWSTKMGTSFYERFQHSYEAYLLRGPTQVDLTLSHPGGNRERYTMVTAHRLPGFSMYNKVHQNVRASKFGIQGAEIYGSFHTHSKGMAVQITQTVDGPLRQLLFTAGPYKYNDDYAQKTGMNRLSEEHLGAVWLVFWPDTHRVEGYMDVESAVDRVSPYLK